MTTTPNYASISYDLAREVARLTAAIDKVEAERDCAEHRLGSLSQEMGLTPGTDVQPIGREQSGRFTDMRKWLGKALAAGLGAPAAAEHRCDRTCAGEPWPHGHTVAAPGEAPWREAGDWLDILLDLDSPVPQTP